MNLFDFVDPSSDLTGMTWADANSMFAEGVEVAESSLNVHLDTLQDFLAALVLDGHLAEETAMQLAYLETQAFQAIHRHAQLQAVTATTKSLSAAFEKWKTEAEAAQAEGA